MKSKTKVILGTVITFWPFIALLSYAILDHSIWNEPNADPINQWYNRLAILAGWTGTLPLTVFIWHRMTTARPLVTRIAMAGIANIAYSACYYGVFYVFFWVVAFGFDHIFI